MCVNSNMIVICAKKPVTAKILRHDIAFAVIIKCCSCYIISVVLMKIFEYISMLHIFYLLCLWFDLLTWPRRAWFDLRLRLGYTVHCVSKKLMSVACYSFDMYIWTKFDYLWQKCYWESEQQKDALFFHFMLVKQET